MTALDDAVRTVAAASRLLVALDFDGVLAPIVEVPAQARALPRAAGAIGALAALPRTTVALVSGRGLSDLAAVSGFGPPVQLIGSHGGEFADADGGPLDGESRDRLERLTAELRELVGGEPGVTLESKPTGMAVHVRNAERGVASRVLDAVRSGPATRPGVAVTPGKEVLDLSVLEVSKGLALDRLRARIGADAVFFAGDDVTDETAFVRLRTGGVRADAGIDVGVKVGEGATAAEHRVADPAAVASLLERLLAARRQLTA
jgi:trehalose 6-phosphate phosphatase